MYYYLVKEFIYTTVKYSYIVPTLQTGFLTVESIWLVINNQYHGNNLTWIHWRSEILVSEWKDWRESFKSLGIQTPVGIRFHYLLNGSRKPFKVQSAFLGHQTTFLKRQQYKVWRERPGPVPNPGNLARGSKNQVVKFQSQQVNKLLILCHYSNLIHIKATDYWWKSAPESRERW